METLAQRLAQTLSQKANFVVPEDVTVETIFDAILSGNVGGCKITLSEVTEVNRDSKTIYFADGSKFTVAADWESYFEGVKTIPFYFAAR